MLLIKPFSPCDVLNVPGREPDKSILQSLADPLQMAREYAMHGPCWTGWVDGRPIFCAGLVLLWEGMAEGWAYTSESVRKYPHEFHRAVHRGLIEAAREHRLRRIQFSIPESHHVSRRWAMSLGFLEESIMPMYGPTGADYVRYVRLGLDQCPS